MNGPHRCSECGRAVGRMLDLDGKPVEYWCPHKQRMAKPQNVGAPDAVPNLIIGERL